MSKNSATFFPTSPRHEAALRISDTLLCLGLDDSYGITMERAVDKKGKSHWSITFCKARTVDGLVRVYSDRYFQITMQNQDRAEVFRSLYDAQSWLVQRFAR